VIVLSTDAGIGGIERATRTLIGVLAELFGADNVGLVSVWDRTPAPDCRLLYRGAASKSQRVTLGRRFAFTAYTLRRAWSWRRNLVLVASHVHLAGVAWLAHAICGAPYIVWCHGDESWGKLRRTDAFSLRRADLVFAPSRFTAERVETAAGLDPGSVRVVPHCLTSELAKLEYTPPPSESTHRVLSVSRLTSGHGYKGVDALILAWPRVLASVPDALLVVVGDGSDKTRLEELARGLQVEANVRFAGALGDRALIDEYQKCGFFALPSRTRVEPSPEGEGFGLVYLEAGAAGRAVVAAKGGAVSEIVRDGKTGLLVNPARPDELPEVLIDLLSNPRLATRLGESARVLVTKQFSPERFRESIINLLREVGCEGI
jgi:phosphatidylinositol alpha-1,6-mannosyltransferase